MRTLDWSVEINVGSCNATRHSIHFICDLTVSTHFPEFLRSIFSVPRKSTFPVRDCKNVIKSLVLNKVIPEIMPKVHCYKSFQYRPKPDYASKIVYIDISGHHQQPLDLMVNVLASKRSIS